MRWVTGDNDPGCLPEADPIDHDTWEEGWHHVMREIEEAFLDSARYENPKDGDTEDYDRARSEWYLATENHPASVVYGGRVWWLADLPVEAVRSNGGDAR